MCVSSVLDGSKSIFGYTSSVRKPTVYTQMTLSTRGSDSSTCMASFVRSRTLGRSSLGHMAATSRHIDSLEPVMFSGYTGAEPVTSTRARDFRVPYFIYMYYLTIRPAVSGAESVEMWEAPEKRTAASRQKKREWHAKNRRPDADQTLHG